MENIDETIVPLPLPLPLPPKSQVEKQQQEDEFRTYLSPHSVLVSNVEDEHGLLLLNKLGLKKKLVKVGQGWQVPQVGDEITVNYAGRVVDGENFIQGHKSVSILGKDLILEGCEDGLVTMKKGEISIFTVPPTVTRRGCFPNIPVDATLQFQVELLSWFKVVDVSNDGGIMKKILHKSEVLERPEKKDEVTVKYEVRLEDGSLVAKSPEEGFEFLVNDGHLCPAIAKTVVTMRKGEWATLRVDPRYAFGNAGRPAQDGLAAVPPNAVVHISLELVAYKLLEYITDDMLIIKKITTCGEGFEKPNSGTTAQIRYIANLSNGQIFEKKGYDGEDALEFKIDEEQVIEGLDLAVATMKRGETALIIVSHEYGFGDTDTNTKLAVIPACSTLYYKVEMLGFTKVTEAWDMEPEEKLEYAAKRKEQGNTYFKAGKYQRASLRYDMASKYVEFDSTFKIEQKKVGRFFKVSCNLNNAACKLKLKEFREAAKLCSLVLNLEPNNVKALYRRAQAYLETMDLDLAKLDLKKALEIDPNNGEVMQLLQRQRNFETCYDKKESKLFANMIEKLKI